MQTDELTDIEDDEESHTPAADDETDDSCTEGPCDDDNSCESDSHCQDDEESAEDDDSSASSERSDDNNDASMNSWQQGENANPVNQHEEDNGIPEVDKTGVEDEAAGVEDTQKHGDGDNRVEEFPNTLEGETPGVEGENAGVDTHEEDPTITESDQFRQAEDAGRMAANGAELPKRVSKPNKKEGFAHNCVTFLQDMEPEAAFALLMESDTEDMLSFLMAQMSAKAGLKHFGEAGAQAVMKEPEQLLCRKVMEGRKANTLTREQKKAALKCLMFLKEKRCGRIEGRGCADGRKQRSCKTKEETSSPTVSLEPWKGEP